MPGSRADFHKMISRRPRREVLQFQSILLVWRRTNLRSTAIEGIEHIQRKGIDETVLAESIAHPLKARLIHCLFINEGRFSDLHDEVCAPPSIRARRQGESTNTLQVLRRLAVIEPPDEGVHLVDF